MVIVGATDYQEIEAESFNLLFDDTFREETFNIFVVDDPSFEDTERFKLELKFAPFSEAQLSLLNIQLTPDIAVITIADNDGMT